MGEEGSDELLQVQAKAGLAAVAHYHGDLERAIKMIRPILDYLEIHETTVYEPAVYYLLGYRIYLTADDNHMAHDLLMRAEKYVQRQSQELPNEVMREQFLYNVQAHQTLRHILNERQRAL